MTRVPRTNVGDDAFLEDQLHKADYRRDVQALDQRGYDLRRDIYGSGPVIFEGLTVENGTGGDTFKILAGRCHDNAGNHIVIESDVDNIDGSYENVTIDTSGNLNYIALKYDPEYSNPAGFAGAVNTGNPYYKITADDYDIYVGPSGFDENSGFVNLATAYKSGGVWYYDHGIAVRSPVVLPANASVLVMTFAYNGAIPTARTFLERHGANEDIHPVPGQFEVKRITAKQDSVSVSDTHVDIYKNGVSLASGMGLPNILMIEAGQTFDEAIVGVGDLIDPTGHFNFDRDDLIQTKAGNGDLTPTALIVTIAGYVTDIV